MKTKAQLRTEIERLAKQVHASASEALSALATGDYRGMQGHLLDLRADATRAKQDINDLLLD